MKAINSDDVLKILHKYGNYIFVTDAKKYSDMVDELVGKIVDIDTVTEFADRCRECGKMKRCKVCRYFEYDSVANVNGTPLIVAHEICTKWGEGCKTNENGYCFLFEPKEEQE